MADSENQLAEANHNTGNKKRSRWESVIQWTEILSALLSLIATIIAGISVNLLSDLIAPRIPTSLVVAFSIALGVIIILYIAVYLYRRQTKIRQLAISELREVEKSFFASVESEISALLSERVS